jgi:thiamine pyrophosphokinase
MNVADLEGFLRHVRACNNAIVPGERLKLRVGGALVGYVRPSVAAALEDQPCVRTEDGAVVVDPAAALPGLARTMADRKLCRWRNEAFDVRSAPGGKPITTVDRGALPVLGIEAEGAHLNGLVHGAGGLSVWVARRADDRPLDPGKLDNVAAGGIAAGLDAATTLVKEAGEEASIPADIASMAREAGIVRYACDRDEGLRRDRLHCYDLELPAGFTPQPHDREIAGFELWPIARVYETVRDTDDFKFNVNLVLIDLLIRIGLITGEAAATLREGLNGPSA